jgi:hypothetical protein
MTISEAWEDKEDIQKATSSRAMLADLPTDQEYWNGTREVEFVDMNGNLQVHVDALTEEEKKLYLDNAKSRANLCVHVSQELLIPMLTAGGTTQKSLYLMKQWFEENYAEVEAEESLQDLTREFNALHPGNFEHAMFYLGNIDNCNARLVKVDATGKYMMDDLQLINTVLSKILDNKDGKMAEMWAPFQVKYREQGRIAGTTWVEFKKHLTREWKQIGSPSGGKSTGKALNVSTPGSAYYPFKCNWCDKAGHKAQNCHDRLAGKPKTKKNGRGGGGGGGKSNAKSSNQGQISSGNKQKKDLSHIKCYKNCGEMDHYKNKCPKEKQESANNVKVVLMVKCAKITENEAFEFVAYTTKQDHSIKTDSLYCKECKDPKDSVHDQSSESLSVKVQSDTKIESPK